MKVRKVQLSDLTESQAHKLRLLKAALEQVMGHEVQTMTLSYTDSGSPRLRVGVLRDAAGRLVAGSHLNSPGRTGAESWKTAFKRCSGRSPSRWRGRAC